MSQNAEALRILQILPTLCVGGAEQMAGHLMVALSETHEVAALSLQELSDSGLRERLRRAGVSQWQLQKRNGFDPRVILGIDRVVRELRPHVVHTHLHVLPYVLPVLMRRRVPLAVHTVHNQAEHEVDALFRIVHRFAFRQRVVPVAISNEIARGMERVYGIECRNIIPNCIPLRSYQMEPNEGIRWREQLGFGADAVLLTSVGRLEAQKDPLALVQAFAEVSDNRAHLVVLGEGKLRPRVTELARALGLESRVHLLGKRRDVAQCLAASDIFVLSSQWEGNPLAVMEAMAAGLPVVGTAVGAVPELVESGRHGILVPPGDTAALAGAMQSLCQNLERRRSMGAAARERASRQFSLQRMVGAYDALYRSALSGGLGRSEERIQLTYEGLQ